MHDSTNGWIQNGQPQVWWPEALGTTPGAMVNEMNHGSSGVPGASYDMQYVDPYDRGATFDQIQRASENGHFVPLFVGDESIPRHIVLVTGADGDSVTIYDPADGRTETVSRSDWEAGNLSVGGWEEPWGAVLPD